MTPILKISLLVGIIVYFVIVVFFLRKHTLTLKYAIIWLISGVLLLVLDLFPGLVEAISTVFGFAVPANTLFTFAIFFMLIVLMFLTSVVSMLNEKIRILIQHFALQEKKVRELEMKLGIIEEQLAYHEEHR